MRHNRLKLIHAAVITAFLPLSFDLPGAKANPTGPQVVSGQASISRPNATTLNVTNSSGAIINWQGFSIGANEITRFIQPSASSAVLNRVVGPNISSLQGQLLSNGRVFLINPAGIVIGPGAMLDTAGFVGSTLNMLNADFLAGKLRFQGDANSGRIINQGWIRTTAGGQVLLVAPQIENSGLIQTPGGEITLAAGSSLTISSLDHEGVQFKVQAPADTVVNVGKLLAEGGAIRVFAGALKHSGDIRATSLTADATGRIILKGRSEVQLAAGSITEANGRGGGRIEIQSGGTTIVAGSMEAKGLAAGAGGVIHLLGDKVGLTGEAKVDASGYAGGGVVLVGGDYRGENRSVQNAQATYVGPDASIKADAIANGDGGKVIVWSDDTARVYGSLSVRGGAFGGNGGFVETSGHRHLDVKRAPEISAPAGNAGTWLLDPETINISAAANSNITGASPFSPAAAGTSTLNVTTLNNALDAGGTVIVDTTGGGAGTGDINLNAAVAKTAGANATLDLRAHNNININQNITSSSGQLNMVLNPNQDNIGGGAVNMSNPVTLNANGGTINAAGRTVNVGSSRVDLQACKLEYSIVSPK